MTTKSRLDRLERALAAHPRPMELPVVEMTPTERLAALLHIWARCSRRFKGASLVFDLLEQRVMGIPDPAEREQRAAEMLDEARLTQERGEFPEWLVSALIDSDEDTRPVVVDDNGLLPLY